MRKLIILIISLKSKRAFKMLLLNACLGLIVFGVIYFTRQYTGVNLNLNEFTFLGSAFLGIPAIIGFLLLNFMF